MINLSQVTNILLGNTPVEQVSDSRGNVLWSAAPVVLPNYFYVEDISGSNNTLSIVKERSDCPTIEVFYSSDTVNWTSMGNTDDITPITATVPANGKLYLKATTTRWGNTGYYGNIITCSGNYNVGGNIMSLLNGDNFVNTSFVVNTSREFQNLFDGSTTLVNARYLVLPNNTDASCYNSMFRNCTSLTTAPELPATTVQVMCYDGMFYNCTSLTTAPTLPATTLAQYCYEAMFQSCTNLNRVTTYANNISASECLTNWLYGVSATGDFFNLGGATYESGASGIPAGWTEHNSL